MEFLFEFGFVGLFLASFLAATVLPFSSEMLLSMMIAANFNLYLCLVLATAGNWLGGLTCYWLGYAGKLEWINKFLKIKQEKLERSISYINRYSSFTAFFCWLPVIGDPIAVALGFTKANFISVSVFMLLGKLTRYAVIGYFIIAGKHLLF
jgi:membrane protein YqaA with SNARE-associated domain